ncbi:MAG TPA: SGNH/GDSL hydrolase family protein, partial [Planctomycetota bacterium]|nr:SGNH/GDSL hydrolase family protein [Planctomycetota bacterium]
MPPLLLAAPLALALVAWRRLSRRAFAALVVGVALGLVGGELALRALGVAHPARAEWSEPQQPTDGTTPAYQPGGELVYRYPTNPRGYFDADGAVRGTINALGYRGALRPREKSPGTFRIALLGDSFTLGIGVRDEDTLAARLEAELEGVEVLDFGVSASDTVDEVRYLEGYVAGFDPDLVAIVFFPNDVGRA